MIEFVREFVVKEEARGQFELAFGPGGAWSNLFGRCAGFRGTTVLRDTRNPLRYLAVDLWDSEAQRQQALAERKAEHAEMESAFVERAESMTELGGFTVLAEATVRPRGRPGRGGRQVGR